MLFLIVLFAQAIAIILLVIFSTTKEHAVILVPPQGINEEYRLTATYVPEGYLGELGLLVAQSLFTVTPASAEFLLARVKSLTHPRDFAKMQEQLTGLARGLREKKVVTVFHPIRLYADNTLLQVRIEGHYTRTVNQTETFRERRIYDLQFIRDGGRVWFSSVTRHDGDFEEGGRQ